MPKKKKGRPRPPGGWAIAVRLLSGARLYYFTDESVRSTAGVVVEQWSPWESQATLFETEREARTVADRFQINHSAREYEVVKVSAPY